MEGQEKYNIEKGKIPVRIGYGLKWYPFHDFKQILTHLVKDGLSKPQGIVDGIKIEDGSLVVSRFGLPPLAAKLPSAQPQSANHVSVKDFGAIGDGEFHSVSEWLVGGAYEHPNKYETLEDMQTDYPMVEDLEWDSIDDIAFMAAQKSAAEDVLLNIYFPTGTYVAVRKPWRFDRHNCSVYGDGKDNTFCVVRSDDGIADRKNALEVNHPNVGGGYRWNFDKIDVYDLSESTMGKNYIDLLNPDLSSKYFVGQLVFIRYGASYYAQDYGEHLKVKRIEGGRIFFHEQIGRDYRPHVSPYHGELLVDFVIPQADETVTVEIENGPVTNGHIKLLTIGSKSFEIILKAGDSYTLKNSYNYPPETLLAGSKIYQAYGIMRFNNADGENKHTILENIFMKDMTFKGIRKGIVADMVYNFQADNCRSIRDSIGEEPNGGLSFEVDMSRHVQFRKCDFEAYPFKNSQISRSSGNVLFDDCNFKDAAPLFTEFNYDCTVKNSRINLVAPVLHHVDAGVGVGASCSNIRVLNNEMTLTNIHACISATDIQEFPQSTCIGHTVKGNNIKANNCIVGLGLMGGHTVATDNEIYGGIKVPIQQSFRTKEQSGVSPLTIVKRNLFVGELNKVMSIKSHTHIEENTFINTAESDGAYFGNIINNQGKLYVASDLRFTNNTLVNWALKPDSVNLDLDNEEQDLDSIDFSNNHFRDCRNKEIKNFTTDLIG